jgi:hypothetical protein
MPATKNPEILERNARRFYGCSLAEAIALNDGAPLRQSRSPANRYEVQRQAAAKRGISWEITFPEWMAVWTESGKWEERGVGKGHYCMSRHGDLGPYKVGNVSIKTIVENSREGIERGRPAMRANTVRRHRSTGAVIGRGKGWAFLPKRKNPYQVYLGKKYIGCFASQDEAEAAFRVAVLSFHESLSVR